MRDSFGRIRDVLRTGCSHTLFHANTAYLFIASDIKALMLPVTVFAHFAAPVFVLFRAILVVSWIALHLLMFGTCNQSKSRREDERNKPWRPIPSGRISEQATARLSLWLYVACIAISIYLGVGAPSIALCCMTACYNRLHMNKHWLLKNLLNAGGFASFELGATILAAGGKIGRSQYIALFFSALIILTTVQVQDFEDEEGDRAIGRKTMALRWGHNIARGSVLVGLLLWSLYPPILNGLPRYFKPIYFLFALSLGVRSYFFRGQGDDRTTYQLYNVWLAIAHLSIVTSNRFTSATFCELNASHLHLHIVGSLFISIYQVQGIKEGHVSG